MIYEPLNLVTDAIEKADNTISRLARENIDMKTEIERLKEENSTLGKLVMANQKKWLDLESKFKKAEAVIEAIEIEIASYENLLPYEMKKDIQKIISEYEKKDD